ncbi:MAG: 2-hydroxyacyl-CoA dehydratase [Syntrophorhabdales bacterium]|jgi:benzoyl-CoA reductase/2-hydroxyglutaryl-CoA dehydratase subunit BcrC/BadD/HgdB
MRRSAGFTTTIPLEVLFAADVKPCDLNNLFVTHPDPLHYVAIAERDGFPTNMCNWIKGIYGVVKELPFDTVVAVLEGDCSNTRALAEILSYRGVRIVPFSFPYDRQRESLAREIRRFMGEFGADEGRVAAVSAHLQEVRRSLAEIDRMTWEDRLVTGLENNLWQLSASDMEGDYEAYGRKAGAFIQEAKGRAPVGGIRVGYIGVPPISPELHAFVEASGCHIVYNEVQRQFSLPYFSGDIVDRYLRYTYPYGIFARIADIKEEIGRRSIAGVIHYVQAFCHRMVEDIIIRESLEVPVITIEGDLPKQLDTRTKTRLEAFIEMLRG